jgi:hypothetical protein
MPNVIVTPSTLETIQTKVRRLTRSPSPSQLTDDQINEYINTFVLYDFPEHLRLFNLRTTFSFITEPYIDVYETSDDVNSVFYNFLNKYITIHPPVYIAGFQALFSESRNQFFSIYPMINSIASIGTAGDGVTTTFTGIVNSAQANIPPYVNNQGTVLLRNNVLFSSIDTNGNGLALIDYPVNSTTGALGIIGTPQTLPSPYGQINYLTGAFTVNFPIAPGTGQPINSQTVPQQSSRPQSLLFYDGQITLRPVPDQPYRVNMEVYIQPAELLSNSQNPELNEWWQLFAYGAAKKVFEDRMDLESVALIMPEYKKQMNLVQRRTIVQQTSQRASTIYAENTGTAGAYGPGLFSGGGQF